MEVKLYKLLTIGIVLIGSYGQKKYSPTIGYYYQAPTAQYVWYGAMNYQGRTWPAGNYYYDGHSWYLKGYGKFNGYEIPKKQEQLELSVEEIKKLKEILKGLEKK